MSYVLAVFRSRTQVLEFTDLMKVGGADCKIMNTPADAHVGCGICSVFSRSYLTYARTIVAYYSLSSFAGFYSYSRSMGRSAVAKIV